jgi:hypothetical protein
MPLFEVSINDILHCCSMGTNPYKEKMPNRNMGREMGKDENEEPQHVNVQEIGTDPQTPGPGPRGSGTNFTHVTKNTTEDR